MKDAVKPTAGGCCKDRGPQRGVESTEWECGLLLEVASVKVDVFFSRWEWTGKLRRHSHSVQAPLQTSGAAELFMP